MLQPGSASTNAEGAARHPDYWHYSSSKRLIKSAAGPAADDDNLSSVAPSPRSVATLDEPDLSYDMGRVNQHESLPPPAYTPQQYQHQEPVMATPQPRYGTVPSQHEENAPLLQPADVEGEYRHQQRYIRRRRRVPSDLCACCTWTCVLIAFAVCGVAAVIVLLSLGIIPLPKEGRHKRPSGPDWSSPHTRNWCPSNLQPVYQAAQRTFALHADPSIDIAQTYNSSHRSSRSILNGLVQVLPAPAAQSEPYVLSVAMESTSQDLLNTATFSSAPSSFHLDFNPSTFPSEDCTQIMMALYVSPGAATKKLSISTTHLSIVLAPSMHLQSDTLSLQTRSAVISARDLADPPPRRIALDVAAGVINGTWPLADLLSITIASGSVDVAYSPKASLPNNPLEPAVLSIHSSAGSLRASPALPERTWRDAAAWPERRFVSELGTSTGVVRDSYIPLGESVHAASALGSLGLHVLPISFPSLAQRRSDAPLATLETSTVAGPSEISILSPVGKKASEVAKVLRGLRAEHKGVTGSVRVQYPAQLEGRVIVEAATGTLSVEGIEVVREEKGLLNHLIEGVRGNGDSLVKGSIGAGFLKVSITE